MEKKISRSSVKILITNLHSSKNAGDAALTYELIKQINQYFETPQIVLLMTEPQSYSGPELALGSMATWFRETKTGKINWLKAPWLVIGTLWAAITFRLAGKPNLSVLPKDCHKVVEAYTQADVVISAPGGFLYSSGAGLGFINSLYTIFYAFIIGKPFYFMPQSFGPLRFFWEKTLLRLVLDKAQIIMVREFISLNLLREIQVKTKTLFVPDIAFAMSQTSKEASRAWLKKHGVNLDNDRVRLGVTLIDWSGQNPNFSGQARYEESIIALINLFLRDFDGDVLIFSQVRDQIYGHDDFFIAKKISSYFAGQSNRVFLIDKPESFDVLRSCYAWVDFFVGTRMHSNIFAAIQGVPVFAIAYQPKTSGIMNTMGLDSWHIDINSITPQNIETKFKNFIENRQKILEIMDKKIDINRKTALRACEFIAQDYYSKK